MKEIELTQGKVAIVDDIDYEDVSRFKWHVYRQDHLFYAARTVNKKNIKMHRYILRAKWGDKVDHKDGNTLRNVRENLRFCTQQLNGRGARRKRAGTSSEFFGVSWAKHKQRWQAYLHSNYKKAHLGYFDSEIEAAEAYNMAALVLDPGFHHLNVIPQASGYC